MSNGPRFGVLVGVPVLLIAVGAVLAALIWMQSRSGASIGQADPGLRRATADQASALAMAAPGAAGRQVVPVRRGTIAEQISLNGRVASTDEVSVGFAQPGRIETVTVKPGDLVEEGQVLVEADVSLIERDLIAARGRLELSSLRYEQAQQSAEAHRREAERRRTTDAARREEAVFSAESALRRAQADYDRVKAGATPAERHAAETAVSNATAALERAEAEYVRAFQPSELEIRQADQQAAAARLDLQKAEMDLARAGEPDPEALRTAERELQDAQTAYSRAVADVAHLTQRTGRPAAETQAAQQSLLAARQAVEQARERLDRVRATPPQLAIDRAQNTVEAARLAVEAADARARSLRDGPSEETVARLVAAVQQAQASLLFARQHLDNLNARPTRAELQDAEEQLALAQQVVERAREDVEQDVAEDDGSSAYDLQVIERSIAQDRAQVEMLEQQLVSARLRAPFAGTVSGIKVRPGDRFEAERPIIILARQGDPVLRADIAERDANKLSFGQWAVAHFEDGLTGAIEATVHSVMEGDGGIGRVVQFEAIWPSPVPPLGTTAQIALTISERDDVLIVPQRAIRSAGPRRYVEVQYGPDRTEADVEVGLVANGQAEIVRGLTEDQLVVVGP